MQFQSGVVKLNRVCVWEKNRIPIGSCQLGTQRREEDSIQDLALVCCEMLCKSLSLGYFEIVKSFKIFRKKDDLMGLLLQTIENSQDNARKPFKLIRGGALQSPTLGLCRRWHRNGPALSFFYHSLHVRD
ncbi:unnamed protein product [Prunus armeniaca]|uniref:Uncharacterized protein n=1 Tax=Prunus armeniaca TaxID=36596 RepID=A0A6J5WKR2_PRUAR|nr:unnamed protein product [Prunus armeniaca]